MRVVYLFTAGPPDPRVELHVPLDRARPTVPTLAPLSFPASRFERELADLFGIVPDRSPPAPPPGPAPALAGGLAPDAPRRRATHPRWSPTPGRSRSSPVEGPGVYEIPVGPVHAGLIEPGHFRFWVVGETILRMKARLWFVHKGIERLFEGKDIDVRPRVAERISGDSAVGHALAYCLAVEDACGVEVPDEAQTLRACCLELERLYNHVADIGALCNDVGFGLAQAWALTLREQLLRLNREVTGHRLLRGGVVPGGARLRRLPTAAELAEIGQRFEELVDLASLEHPRHGALHRHGGARRSRTPAISGSSASSLERRASAFDARMAHPFVEPDRRILPGTAHWRGRAGPLLGPGRRGAGLAVAPRRARRPGRRPRLPWPRSVRWSVPDPADGGVGIAEGWRGAVVHRVELDDQGRLARVKVVDPSFLNWPALPVSLADTIVPDFPLANKSFNLSYAGNDL